jgi:hypothetical protein
MDIVGVILLWRFGLPPDVNRHGARFVFPASASNSAEAVKAKIYDFFAKVALLLIVLGFVFQFIGSLNA